MVLLISIYQNEEQTREKLSLLCLTPKIELAVFRFLHTRKPRGGFVRGEIRQNKISANPGLWISMPYFGVKRPPEDYDYPHSILTPETHPSKSPGGDSASNSRHD